MLDSFKSLHVEACVALQCIVEGCPVLGECRWVEDDEVVEILGVVEELECVLAECLMALVAREIQSHVGVGQLYCFGAAVHGVHEVGSAAHGVE